MAENTLDAFFGEDEQGETEDTQLTSEEVKAQEAEATEAAEKQEHLEAGVEERMAKIRGDEPTPESELEGDPGSTPEGDQKQDEEATPEGEPAADSEAKDDEPAGEGTPEGEGPAGDEHALTEAEMRAAIHRGATEEDIQELVKANPAMAKRMCAKALADTNNLSTQFSEIGKRLSAADPGVTPEPSKVEPLDLSALEAEYEGEPGTLAVLKQLATQNHAYAQAEADRAADVAVQKAEAREDAAMAAEDAATSQQITTFFTDPKMQGYGEFYGVTSKEDTTWLGLTIGQTDQRMAVVEHAALIRAGAESQGQEMSIPKALELAHLSISTPVQEEVIRKKISQQLKERAKGITLQPGTGTKIVATGEKPNRAQLEALTAQRLKKCFG